MNENSRARSPLFALLVLTVLVIAGICLISQGFKMRNLNARFDGPMTRVQGTVDDLTSFIGRRSTSHSIAYHYSAPDGQHQVSDGVTVKTWNSQKRGSSIPVKFLPGDPGLSRIDLPSEDERYREDVWIDFGGGIVLLGGSCFFYWRKTCHA